MGKEVAKEVLEVCGGNLNQLILVSLHDLPDSILSVPSLTSSFALSFCQFITS